MTGKITKFLKIAIGLLVVSLVIFLLLDYGKTTCEKTVRFNVSSVDPRFKISLNEAASIAKEAALRINTQAGRQLLAYDSKGNVKINLVYDQRQAEIDRIQSEADRINSGQSQVASSNAQLESLIRQYETKLSAYNQEVNSWNKKGGAPPDVYRRLQSESQDLELMKTQIENLSNSLNSKVTNYNNDVTRFNEQIESENNIIITQGLYYPKNDKIDIFTFGNKEELRLVLMHEMGHALGLEHALNEKSIMYYLLTKQSLTDPILSNEDKKMINNRCSLTNKSFFMNIFKRFQNSLQ